MKKRYVYFLAFFFFFIQFNSVEASAVIYLVDAIPDSLLKSACMVKRIDETIMQIKSPAKATIYRKYAYTILDESGQKYASFSDYYNRFRQITAITGTLYDRSGNKLRQVKKRDINDGAIDDEMSLMTDTRYKHFDFFYKAYPYTVEFEEEVELNGIFDLPDWRAIPEQHIALENSSLSITTPEDYALRYKQYNYNRLPFIETVSKGKKYTWALKNYRAMSSEPFSPDWDELTPTILIAPTQFEIEGYKGIMDDWLHFGQFIGQLYNGKDVLPQTIREKVHQLTADIKDQKEKIKALYAFMQQNTRYISIQLGIGGWQPFDASFVATKKYGDCKALSNYMCALLKEAGIKGNTVLIYGGAHENNMITDFPSNQFNHAIACVPMEKDTMWLECTSQTASAGYMGSFTGNRKALLIGTDGGYVVSTPSYKAENNLQLRKVNAVIDEIGNLQAEVNTHFTGEQEEQQHRLMYHATKEQRDKYLNTVLELPTYKVSKADYKEVKGAIPEIFEYLKIESPAYATVTGKRMFIQPNLFNKNTTRLLNNEERKYDIVVRSAYRDVDTVLISIPPGYTAEAVPVNVSINNQFGVYNITYHVNDDRIELIRVRESHATRYSPGTYQELVKLFEDIYKADRGRVVLVKKQ